MSKIKIWSRVSTSSLTLDFTSHTALDANSLTKTGDRLFNRCWHSMVFSSYGISMVHPRTLLL